MKLKVGYSDGSGPEFIVDGDKAVACVRWGCDCCKSSMPPTPDEIAMANLIAASPDLLAALKIAEGAFGALEEVNNLPSGWGKSVVAPIRAAIARAEGTK